MAASSSSSVRSWRTAFLTLRDETLTSSPRSSVPQLIHTLILSHSQSMIAAAPDLPLHEVTSDLLFLMDWVANVSEDEDNMTSIFTDICHFIHDICHRVSVEMNASSWTVILDWSRKIVEYFLGKAGSSNLAFSGNAAFVRPVIECLETVRRVFSVYKKKYSLSENIQLVKFLLQTVVCSHTALYYSAHSSGNQRFAAEFGKKIPRYSSLWEVQTVAFSMLGEAFVRSGSTFPVDVWKSVMEVCRKVMDVLASKSLLVEDSVMSRFYTSLLHCLHLVLTDPKGSLSDHVSGLVAALRMFFIYGLTSGPKLTGLVADQKEKEINLGSSKSCLEEPMKKDRGPYRPPHLRKKDSSIMKPTKVCDSPSFSDHESSTVDLTSSDSDCSDSDGSLKDTESIRSSKVRVAAIMCIQDLCQADPKYFTTQWTALLPTNDVLIPRKFEANLLTCLQFDPYLKARITAASTLAVMLDGPSSLFLQVAEYKESTKRGSFTALSSSLGEILMQLHTGILHLIKHETHSRLLASLFKILKLLISSTPYSRMPRELLLTVILSLQARIEEGISLRSDWTGLLVASISCLTSALSTSPASPHVKAIFIKEISTGFVEAENRSGILSTLFQNSKGLSNPTICFEALQTLRAVCHNYPNIAFACWEQISSIVYGILKVDNPDIPTRPWKGHIANPTGFIGEKVITAAIKVVDECLRAISGFKGTEDVFDEKLSDTPFTSDCTRMKNISSAPYFVESTEDMNDGTNSCHSGTDEWCEAIEKHIPLILWNSSAMVRTASVTCFAGITSSVFFALTKEKQDFILSSVINAAEEDVSPSVRSAACRAIGVISCFLQVSRSAEILNKFINAVEINTRDPLVSVRITASWALANICDSFRHCIGHCCTKFSEESKNTTSMALLTECALRLTKDGDKIKSNAVRALGNLSKFVKYKRLPSHHDKSAGYTGSSYTTNSTEVLPSSSDEQGTHSYLSNEYAPDFFGDSLFLERMVQAFLSCVTTGNVKVQWNVCHAISNLFSNETLRLQEMDWAPSVFSILLLLLRDASNFKIRIQAAAALAVPASALDYGKSFSDVVQGLEHILENLGSDQISAPSSFKYRVVLEKQLSSTMLHVLSLASSSDHEPLKDFVVKKASYLEEWLKVLCSSLGEPSNQPDVEDDAIRKQKKHMISKAMRSLMEIYEGRNLHTITQKLKNLEMSIM